MGRFGEDAIRVSHKHLQSAYIGLQKSLQQEWALVQRVTSDIGDAFGPVEKYLQDTFMPDLFQDVGDRTLERGVILLIVKHDGLSLPDPTRRPVRTQDTVQLSRAVRVRPGRASPACFTGRRVIALPGDPSPTPSNSAGKNAVAIYSSTGPKASPIPGVTRCTNAHSCWSDFCSPAYVDCGCLRATPANVRTDSAYPYTFCCIHLTSAALSPTNPPRYRLPVTTRIPIPRKYSLALGYIPFGHNQDALGWLQIVPPGRPPQLEVPEVGHDITKLPPRPPVIRIPRLHDAGVGSP